jgi:exodeoxyribonuclease VII small subunit
MTELPSQLSDLSYEQAFNELESIVAALEGEQKPLDETVKLYERGQLLVQFAWHCWIRQTCAFAS